MRLDEEGLSLADLGPLDVAETDRAARMRLHQAWYRVRRLGISDYGRLPKPSGRPSGSVLSMRAADEGVNFTSDSSRRMYEERRGQGWGVEPFRCTAVMTSSQTLTFNLMGPLAADLRWAQRALKLATDLPIAAVRSVAVEVAPKRPIEHLNDRTYIDALIDCDMADGRRLALSFEVKLVDRYVSRIVPLGLPYDRLCEQVEVWVPGVTRLVTRESNQLFRTHALSISMRRGKGCSPRSVCVLLHHPLDDKAASVSQRYAKLLLDPGSFQALRLDVLLAAMKHTAKDVDSVSVVSRLHDRYMNLEGSAFLWQEWVRHRASRGRVPQADCLAVGPSAMRTTTQEEARTDGFRHRS